MNTNCDAVDSNSSLFDGGSALAKKIEEIDSSLKSTNKNQVLTALDRVTSIEEVGHAVVPTLVHLSTDQDPDIRKSAIHTLAKLDTDAKIITYSIKRCLTDQDAEVRIIAANALATLGKRAAQAVFDLADRALNDPDPDVQRHSCHALGEIGPLAAGGLPAIVECLRSGDDSLRETASEALLQLADEAIFAKPALIQALQDSSVVVRENATRALYNIGSII